ncbi:hypothetical protein AGABI1DRAFT_46508, partial [Agaricus bisporus var. burnettii JB137-S8]
EPKEEPKPQPIGYMPMVVLFTTCVLCALFILWRRADGLRQVVAHKLKAITRQEGGIRLSEDDGPPAREFLEDDDDEDNEVLPGNNSDDEPLAHHIQLEPQKGNTVSAAHLDGIRSDNLHE